MRKLFSIMNVSFLLIIAAACGSNEVNGNESANIPVEWANADVQKDQSKKLDLLEKKETLLDPEDKPDNKNTIKNYKLTQWKVNEDNYYYEITYENPTQNNKLKTEKMEVIRTDSGWKRTKYGDIYNFDKLVEDLKPEVLRELHDE